MTTFTSFLKFSSCINFALKQIRYLPKRSLCSKQSSCSSVEDASSQNKENSIENYFLDERVQNILLKITGIDYEKLFQPKKQKLSAPIYKFVTDKKLAEMRENTKQKALAKLQMPPVMKVREPINEVLSFNPELQGYEESNIVFIDISSGFSDRERFITVREPDGTLRKANWDERFRMNQIYFPFPGRKLIVPKFFESPYLDRLLEEESYVFLLDSACVQFDPDDPEYHRVTQVVYEDIERKKTFNILRSTRHFGPMAFYFAYRKNIGKLLVDMIERDMISDAADLIKLLYIIHPDVSPSQKIEEMTDEQIVTEFVSSNKSTCQVDLELAFQTYKEIHQKDVKNESAV